MASSPFLEVSLLFLEETHGVAESPYEEGILSCTSGFQECVFFHHFKHVPRKSYFLGRKA